MVQLKGITLILLAAKAFAWPAHPKPRIRTNPRPSVASVGVSFLGDCAQEYIATQTFRTWNGGMVTQLQIITCLHDLLIDNYFLTTISNHLLQIPPLSSLLLRTFSSIFPFPSSLSSVLLNLFNRIKLLLLLKYLFLPSHHMTQIYP